MSVGKYFFELIFKIGIANQFLKMFFCGSLLVCRDGYLSLIAARVLVALLEVISLLLVEQKHYFVGRNEFVLQKPY